MIRNENTLHYKRQIRQTDIHSLLEAQEDAYLSILSRFSHDIKNLLFVLYGTYQLAEDKEPGLKEFAMWPRIGQAIQELNNYMDETSRFHSSFKITPSLLNISDILFDLPDSMDDIFEDEVRYFNFSVPKTLPPIMGDQDKLMTAMTALLMNSYEATQENAVIDIEANADKSTLQINIKDSGRGMDKQLCEQASNPFYTTKQNHLGLGLSIANIIIQKHHGKLNINSSPLTGTSITIELPLYLSEHK